MNKNLSIAVHLHLYYLDMWPQIKQYLANLDDYDLFVTMNAENRDIIEEIKKFHPATAFYVVENKGYDVGPFIFFLNRIDLNRYDLILKIHTKSNKNDCNTMLNGRYLNRKYWFRLLVEALIGTKEIFRQNIKAFQKDAEMGMIGSKYCIMSGKKDTAAMKEKVTEVMSELGFPEGEARTFAAGTMFMVRSELLQKVKDKYGIDDFAATKGLIERVVGNNEDVIEYLGTMGQPVAAVTCILKKDDTSENGFFWSSEKGKSLSTNIGRVVDIKVVINESAPITKLIPGYDN